MKNDKGIFKDPKGKFAIKISPNWRYFDNEDNVKKGLYQFEVSEECVFQISCKPINKHISKIIAENQIKPHEPNLPNISYIEKYIERPDMHSYVWKCQIEDHFILAVYFYNPQTKPNKEIGLDLMDIRLSLRYLNFNVKNTGQNNSNKYKTQQNNFSDIESWRNFPDKFLAYMSQHEKFSVHRISPLETDVVKLYSLLKTKISEKPNGFYDAVRLRKPLDNPIWWDFIFECDKGFVQIWRTAHVIEAIFYFEGSFDLNLFLEENINKYLDDITENIKSFEKHTLYINHYQSYKECVRTLWEEILLIDLKEPKVPTTHFFEKEEDSMDYSKEIKKFSQNSIKYHALAKSLVLNAAFKIESYLNLIIRVGSIKELKLYPDVLNKFLRHDFTHKAKNLKFYSTILKEGLDLGSVIYREAKELMTLRNKYVHFDEDVTHNKLGEIFYDDDYPLHPIEYSRPAIQSIKQMYHTPDMEVVKKAKETSEQFVEYIESLLIPEIKSEIIFLVGQNPIGYNEKYKVYSSVYNPNSLDFFLSMKGEEIKDS